MFRAVADTHTVIWYIYLHLGIPLISRDRRIQASGLTTIW